MAKTKPLLVSDLATDMKPLSQLFNHADDFPCVLVVASFIDQCLRTLLANHFLNGETASRLLDHEGAIGTYQGRADLCYVLALVDKITYQNVCTIGRARNEFAHHHTMKDFSDPKIEALVCELENPQFAARDFPAEGRVHSFFVAIGLQTIRDLLKYAAAVERVGPPAPEGVKGHGN